MKIKTNKWVTYLLLTMAILFNNCFQLGLTTEDATQETDTILLALTMLSENMEINGSFNDNWGASYTISAKKENMADTTGSGTWVQDTTTSSIIEFSNTSKVVYTKSPVPSWCTGQGTSWPNCECFTTATCYNRNVWTLNTSNNKYYYCQIVFNKPTLDDAKNATATATPIDITSSCGGFSWNRLDPK